MTPPTCYVCGNPIKDKAVGIGQGLFRHPSKCRPGNLFYHDWMADSLFGAVHHPPSSSPLECTARLIAPYRYYEAASILLEDFVLKGTFREVFFFNYIQSLKTKLSAIYPEAPP